MARNIGVNFNGKRIVRPGAHSRIDTSALNQSGTSTAKTLILVGSAESGEPGVVHFFRNSQDARAVLRGGDLMTAGELAWSPSGDGIGAGTIGFLRVEDAEKAELTKAGVKLTSKIYGEVANRLQAKLEDGTIAGSKRLSLYFWPDNIREVYDNIGPIFKLKYTGSQAVAVVAVEKVAGVAKTLSIKVGADLATATPILSYTLGEGQFREVNKLVTDINDHPDLSAAFVPAGNKNIETSLLDAVEDVDIKVEKTVKAELGDIIHQLRYSRVVDVEVDDTAGLPANFNFESFQGGSNGEVPASWASKFDLLYGKDGYNIVALTADEAVHAELARFINRMSTAERSEMRGYYGGGLGEALDLTIGRAATLNSERSTLCAPGITRAIAGGGKETLPAYFTAAMIAGRASGVPVGEPITLDYLNLIGLEKVLESTQIDQLVEAGVTVVEYVQQANRKGFRIVQGITTYQDDANPALREIAIAEITDFLNRGLREKLEETFVGTRGTVLSANLVKNETQSFLDDKVREGLITEYEPSSVTVILDGDVVYVNYEAMPSFGINYVLISGKYYRKPFTA